jgi:hypothetical protein
LGIRTNDETNQYKTNVKKMKKTITARRQAITREEKIKKIMLIGTGITATGIAAYFGWQYYKKSQDGKQKNTTAFTPMQDPIPEYKPNTPSPQETNNTFTPPYINTNSGGGKSNTGGNANNNANNNSNTYSPPKPNKDFPLKRGSRGEKVRQLQQALIATNGASILPKYGADGDFGSELVNALRKLNYASVISESLFHVITGGYVNYSKTNTGKPSIAKLFLESLSQHNYKSTIDQLKALKTKSDYIEASTEFKNYRVNGGVRQTLVNACLNAFVDAKQKQAIRLEFLRMGLKYNGTQWSLDGLGGEQIMTTRDTQVWLDGFTSMPVPCRMILGKPITARLDYTMFEKDGKHFLVKTKDIQVIK